MKNTKNSSFITFYGQNDIKGSYANRKLISGLFQASKEKSELETLKRDLYEGFHLVSVRRRKLNKFIEKLLSRQIYLENTLFSNFDEKAEKLRKEIHGLQDTLKKHK